MLGRGTATRPKVVDLNLVPLEMRQPFISQSTLALAAILVLGIALLAVIDRVRADAWVQILNTEDQIKITKVLTQKENERIAAQGSEAARVEQEIRRLKEDLAGYATNPQTQYRRLIPLAPLVDVVLSGQPAGLRITNVIWQEPKFSLHGRAANVQAIMAFSDRLRETKRFSRVDLRQMAAITDKSARPDEELSFLAELEVAREVAK